MGSESGVSSRTNLGENTAMSYMSILRVSRWVLFILVAALPLRAQPPSESSPTLPIIADEPKTIDPGEVLPQRLAAVATRDFSDSSLREVIAWLQDEQQMVVLLDKNALAEIGVTAAEPVSDRLMEAPLYLLLNRLRSLGLDWYYDDEILHITSREVGETRATTRTYNVGSLLDEGFDLDRLEDVIRDTIAPDSWENVGGEGVVSSLGDVLFVRQNDDVHREVAALLKALGKPGRQTFLNDPTQHQRLREKLQGNVSVDFQDSPLEAAVQRLAEEASVDVRLDVSALRNARIREREPVTLKLADRSLETVLRAVVLDLDLTWVLRDGVLWITSAEAADEFLKTAVYDVRDLCRDSGESEALIGAIKSQAEPSSWDDVGGDGSIEFAKPGILVIGHREQSHQKVLQLLETYRSALRSSKPRQRSGDDPNEVTTVYYRLNAKMARDLSTILPLLVRPDSWKSDQRMEAPGTILVVSSIPEPSGASEVAKIANETDQSLARLFIERAVLIVQQTRAAHEEIAKVIARVESGDARTFGAAGMMGGGMGMGGFGGGFFSVGPESALKHIK
jgi:hypothetical protein